MSDDPNEPESSPERRIAIEALQALEWLTDWAEANGLPPVDVEAIRQRAQRSLAGLNAAFEKEPQ